MPFPHILAGLLLAGGVSTAAAQADVALHSLEGPIPGRSAADVELDDFGFLWFGTQGGLVRYDGAESRVYLLEHSDTSRSSPNIVAQLLREPGGHVWASNSRGIVRVDPASDTLEWLVGGPDSLFGIDARVRELKRDETGTVWFVVFGTSVCRWVAPAAPACVEHPPGAPAAELLPRYLGSIDLDAVMGLEPDGNGGSWVVFRNRLRHLDAEGQWSVPEHGDPIAALLGDRNPFDFHVRGLEDDGQGRLWVGVCFLGLLHRWDPTTGEMVAFPPSDDMHDCLLSILVEDGSDRVWVSTARGVGRLAVATSDWDFFAHFPIPAGGFGPINARGMIHDAHGNLWVSHSKGIAWISRVGGVGAGRQFRTLRYRPGWEHTIPMSQVWDALPTGDGGLWLAFGDEGLGRTDRLDRQERRWTEEDGLASNRVRKLATDDYGRLWVASGAGLDLLDPETGRLLHISGTARLAGTDASAPGVLYLVRGTDGVIWTSGRDGVHRLRPSANMEGPHRIELVVSRQELGQLPMALREDPEGLWIGLFRGGLARWNDGVGPIR